MGIEQDRQKMIRDTTREAAAEALARGETEIKVELREKPEWEQALERAKANPEEYLDRQVTVGTRDQDEDLVVLRTTYRAIWEQVEMDQPDPRPLLRKEEVPEGTPTQPSTYEEFVEVPWTVERFIEHVHYNGLSEIMPVPKKGEYELICPITVYAR
jgi:hypothetical protein